MHPTLHLLIMEAERDYRAVLDEREQQIALAMHSPRPIHRDLFRTWYLNCLAFVVRLPASTFPVLTR
jgi:hypothetical protein